MTDSFLILTILGIVIAVYSVLPEHKKLRIGYSFRKLEITFLLVLGGAIIAFSIGGYFLSIHFTYSDSPVNKLNLNTLFVIELVRVIAAIVILAIFLIKFLKKTVSIKNEKYFNERIHELRYERSYSCLAALVDDNYHTIFHSGATDKENFSNKIKRELLDRQFITYIANFKPYFGLRIIIDTELDFFIHEFADLYFEALLRNKDSALYREIENNQNLSRLHRYSIPESNRIIYSFFSNISLAKDLEVYRPIGEGVIDILNKQQRKERDVYNEYQEGYIGERQTFDNPIFIGIRFFDIMIMESIYQKVDWHMWLYYYSHFVDKICKNYRINEYSQPETEFPSTYSYLLYEITSNLRHWIELIEDDTAKIKQKLQHVDCSHENNNILKSSIICLVQCSHHILDTDAIPPRFKEYLTYIMFNLYFKLALSTKKIAREYGKVIACCISYGIQNYGKGDSVYRRLLIEHLGSFDKVTTLHKKNASMILKELENRLRER